MIVRVVKMELMPESVSVFLENFNLVKEKIANFKGCLYLELLKHSENNIFFTYSVWESEEALQHYRSSKLFITTWKKTKRLFKNKAQAWSCYRHYSSSENTTPHLSRKL